MTRADEFTRFYASSAPQVLAVTHAICGDREIARTATIDAYRRLWRDWEKLRGHELLAYVRTEAWKATSMRRGAKPLRKRGDDDAADPLLQALGELSVDTRRLIVLLTLGAVDLAEAAHEVGVTSSDGMESVTTGLNALENKLETDLSDLENRLQRLSSIDAEIELPDASELRSKAFRGRVVNTVALVTSVIVLIALGGFAVTDGGALATLNGLPDREQVGAERPDLTLNAAKLSEDDLLTAKQVTRVNSKHTWKVNSTDTDTEGKEPYATCPDSRFADPDPERAFVRTFSSDSDHHERMAQGIEVSKSTEKAKKAHRRQKSWYADCERSRVQLMDSYTVERPFGNFTVLRLRSHSSPARTFTVGLAHSGTITSTVVHEIDGENGPDVEEFAATLNASIMKLCDRSGGKCSRHIKVERTDPPPIGEEPQFLAVVDLPPIKQTDEVWDSADADADNNPATTPCEDMKFTTPSVSSQLFVIPGAKKLPGKFGLAETVGRFKSAKAAKEFVSDLTERVNHCKKDNLAAEVSKKHEHDQENIQVVDWKMTFEVSKKKKSHYRMSLIRRGSDVAQLTFTSTPKYDLNHEAFASLAIRAGQRLGNLD